MIVDIDKFPEIQPDESTLVTPVYILVVHGGTVALVESFLDAEEARKSFETWKSDQAFGVILHEVTIPSFKHKMKLVREFRLKMEEAVRNA